VRKAIDLGLRQIEINISGPGTGRETAIRSVQNLGIPILSIKDVTALPHNGCRPAKKRRI
jgi:small subunit ribosomal protein S11